MLRDYATYADIEVGSSLGYGAYATYCNNVSVKSEDLAVGCYHHQQRGVWRGPR